MSGGGSDSGSSGGGTTTTVQQADPWSGVQGYLQNLYAGAQALPTPQYYSNPVTAAADPLTAQAQNQLLGNTSTMQNLADTSAWSNQFAQTAGRDVKSNPYLQSAIQAAISPLETQYQRVTGRQIGDAAGQAGQFGSTRHGVAEGIALDDLGRRSADVTSTMASRGYETGLENATKAMALAPTTAGMQTLAPQTTDAVAQQRQAYQQQLIDDAINKWNFEQNRPSAMLEQQARLYAGAPGGTTTGMSTTSGGNRSSPLLSGVGGAMMGYQAANMMGSMAGMGTALGPYGAAAGLLLSFL